MHPALAAAQQLFMQPHSKLAEQLRNKLASIHPPRGHSSGAPHRTRLPAGPSDRWQSQCTMQRQALWQLSMQPYLTARWRCV